MSNTMEATAKLIDDKVQMSLTVRDNPPLTSDYFPPMGQGKGHTPLEILLASLASCSGTATLFILRKMQKDVTEFRVDARGQKREQQPPTFEKFHLSYYLKSKDATEADLQKAVQMSEDSYCAVWAMLKDNARLKVEMTNEIRVEKG